MLQLLRRSLCGCSEGFLSPRAAKRPAQYLEHLGTKLTSCRLTNPVRFSLPTGVSRLWETHCRHVLVADVII